MNNRGFRALAWGPCLAAALATAAAAADPPVRSDRPYPVSFPAQKARSVRVVILANSSAQPCIDELEVYGPGGRENLALAAAGAEASASSCLPGYSKHTIAHLNDGRYGNDFSWIAATAGREWARIDLPRTAVVSRVVLSRDRERRYADRVPVRFDVQVSADGARWTTVRSVRTTAVPVAVRRRPGDLAAGLPPPPPPPAAAPRGAGWAGLLRAAFLAEEHAWLKVHGRADLSPRLVPYNGRVKEYPRHADDDVLPLPPLSDAPQLDGRLDDRCWERASRGVARVAWPRDFRTGPLVSYAVSAGTRDDKLWLAIRTNRLLSSHVAVVSAGDGEGLGVLAVGEEGLEFRTYSGGRLETARRVEGTLAGDLTCCEACLPLGWFPGCRQEGFRVGLGLGGKHTARSGRAVNFRFSRWWIRETAPCVNRTFRVRLGLVAGGPPLTLRGNTGKLAAGLTLAPGESTAVLVEAGGPIGPEFKLTIEEEAAGGAGAGHHVLNLLRYDPLERTLSLMRPLARRLEARGVDVAEALVRIARLAERHEELLASSHPDRAAERQAFFDARKAKRELFFRDPALRPIEKILFVKRHAFEPSHNYSVLLDSAWRPGGGIYRLHIPRREGRFVPEEARLENLFASGDGIARTPVAGFDLKMIYCGYRPSRDGYYHIVSMNPDGSDVRQLTDGPFHDYWPCPLPDGGIAFISTRCKARYLCWRPQAAVLFRMEADGTDIRPLSFANLSEWAPSVMSDGRLIWTRSEYIDKGADFSHTLWAVRPEGTRPELVFGNTIIQPNGYANGREVPGTHEICCTLISHFGDLNGPIALVNTDLGPFNASGIHSITPEVPWPGMWPREECFRDPFPISRDLFLCSHAPRRRFGLYVIDRFGNRELLHMDSTYGSMCPVPYRRVEPPPVLRDPPEDRTAYGADGLGQFVIADVYEGLEPDVPRGAIKYIRVVQELRADLIRLPDGSYQNDHTPFEDWYATPVHKVAGPHGWPSYVAKATWGLAPVEEDGSASFLAPAGKVLYFQALDGDFNEVQRMRSVVQLQPGEKRSCIGCHEKRSRAPVVRRIAALRRAPSRLEPPPWGGGPVSYEEVVQPVWDARCVSCHGAGDKREIDLRGRLDADFVPASYRTLISQGWVHYLDCGYNSGGNAKVRPLTFGSVKSRLWKVLDAGHHHVALTVEERRRIKCWIDMNCPLWPDYVFRPKRRR